MRHIIGKKLIAIGGVEMNYYSDGGEYVYNRKWWQDVAYDRQTPVVVELMKREIGGEPWCKYFGEFVDTQECCGFKNCQNRYIPRNGKGGICTSLTKGFVGTGKKFRISEKGSVKRA